MPNETKLCVTTRQRSVNALVIFVVTVLASLACGWPYGSYTAIPVAVLLIKQQLQLVWTLKTLKYSGVILAAVYLPAIPGFFNSCSHCKQFWLEFFPITPGIVPSTIIFRWIDLDRNGWVSFPVAAIMVGGLVIGLNWFGRWGRGHTIMAVIFGLVWSVIATGVLSAMIQA